MALAREGSPVSRKALMLGLASDHGDLIERLIEAMLRQAGWMRRGEVRRWMERQAAEHSSLKGLEALRAKGSKDQSLARAALACDFVIGWRGAAKFEELSEEQAFDQIKAALKAKARSISRLLVQEREWSPRKSSVIAWKATQAGWLDQAGVALRSLERWDRHPKAETIARRLMEQALEGWGQGEYRWAIESMVESLEKMEERMSWDRAARIAAMWREQLSSGERWDVPEGEVRERLGRLQERLESASRSWVEGSQLDQVAKKAKEGDRKEIREQRDPPKRARRI